MEKVRRDTPPAATGDLATAIQRDAQTMRGGRERRADDLTSPDQHHATSVDQELALLSSKRSADTTQRKGPRPSREHTEMCGMEQVTANTKPETTAGSDVWNADRDDVSSTLDSSGPHESRFTRERWPRSSHIGVSLVIPAMNEELNIPWVLKRIPTCVDEVILVDGNSVDRTVAVSRALRPDIRVVGQSRPGKGNALRSGFAAARGDVIVMIDADCSMDPGEIGCYLALLEEGFDLVKGSRFMDGGGTDDMERLRRWGNGVLRGLVNGLYGSQFTDLCYGFSAFRRDRLPALALASDGFEIETEIIVRAIKAGLQIAEVPSFEAPRAHGESNLNTWRDGRRVLRTLLHHRFTRRHVAPIPDVAPTPVVEPAVLALAPELAVSPMEAHG